MKTAITTILITLTVLVALWVAVFGTAGALLSRHSQMSRPIGFLVGSLLGPIGLVIIWLRAHRRTKVGTMNSTPASPIWNTPTPPSSGSGDSFSI